ncbi:PaaI family thioesterase [Lacisediminimonas profundi]|uniref:PaaI family thioesterase n=1 Tax=Lacisediminimonas profundi TaxID=2603856 RepID=UPI00124B20D7|nr:PaaI family thioesterase [Lacisediminimonas profundi]
MSHPAHGTLNQQELQAIVDRSPFNRWLGMTVESVSEESILLRIRWREELISSPERQSTHGGILATLIDTSGDYAVAARIGRALPTVDLRVDYHRTATPGDLLAEARVVNLGGTLATADSRITDLSGRLIASGRGLYLTANPPKADGGRSAQ